MLLTVQETLKRMGLRRPVRYGDLKYVSIGCKDLAQLFIPKAVRLLNRFLGRFQIHYVPKISGDCLLVAEDNSAVCRNLVKEAISKGIKTFVVQHGNPCSPTGYAPLYADYMFCWKESIDKLVSWGIPKHRLLPFKPQQPKIRKLNRVESVLFLYPALKGIHHSNYHNYSKVEIMRIVKLIEDREPDLLLKPHPKHIKQALKMFKGKRITLKKADDLIVSAKRIYCWDECTVVKDCEVLGKRAIKVYEDISDRL